MTDLARILIRITLAATLVSGCSRETIKAATCDHDLYEIAALHTLGESPCDSFECDIIALHKFTANVRARASRQRDVCMKAAMNGWADFWERNAKEVTTQNDQWNRGVALSQKAQP